MTALDALGQFLVARFPFWGACDFQFDPTDKVLNVHCQTRYSRALVIKDRFQLARLDIGIERLVVIHPNYADFPIFISHHGPTSMQPPWCKDRAYRPSSQIPEIDDSYE